MLAWQRVVEKQGFAILRDALTPAEVTKLLEDLSHISVQPHKAGIRHVLGCPGISPIAWDLRLLGAAQQILGPTAFPFRATLFDKSPAHNWLIAWHQDTALPICERRNVAGWGPWSIKDGTTYAHAPAAALCQILALRVHLDASILENGPLRVLPGTHILGVLSD